MKTQFLILLLSTLCAHAFCQSKIIGKVTTPDGSPVPFVNVLLMSSSDSSLVKGVVSNDYGEYKIDKVNAGKYFLKYSAIGYSTDNSSVFVLSVSDGDKDLGTRVMNEDIRQLNEVTVRAEKSLYEQGMDKTVINVQSSVLTKGSTVMEVLQRSPGILFDQQSNDIVLNGKKGVGVMINGKLVRLSSSEIVNLLSGMSANNIKKIEILSTPPAKYDAEGVGGLINIEVNRNEEDGTNGSVSLTGGYGLYPKSVLSANVNHRKKNLNVYGNYSLAYDKSYWGLVAHGTFRFPFENENINRTSNYLNVNTPSKWVQNATIGLDYAINDKTTLSISSILSETSEKSKGFTRAAYTIYGDSLQLFLININGENNWRSAINSVNIERVAGKGGKIAFDVDYLYYKNYNPSDYKNTYQDKNGNEIHASNFVAEQKADNQTPINILVYKTDYEKKLNSNTTLQAGFKVSDLRMENSVKVWYSDQDELKYNSNISYQLKMQEAIGAAYSSVAIDLGKTKIDAGLRYEFTRTDIGYDTPGKAGINRRYGNFFPSIFVTRKISSQAALQFSYNRRISRPAFTAIASPVRFYDVYAMAVGNPSLKPTITDNIKAQLQYKDFLFSLQFSNDNNQIVDFQRTIGTDSIGYAKSMNLVFSQSLTFQTSSSLQVTPWWRMQNTVLLGYKEFEARNFGDKNWGRSYYLFNLNSTQNIDLPRGFSFEVSGYYYTSDYNGCYKRYGLGAINVGVKKELKNNLGAIQLAFPDLLMSTHYRLFIEPGSAPNNSSHRVDAIPESRKAFIVKLTYSKSFGNTRVKNQRQRSLGSTDERDRLK